MIEPKASDLRTNGCRARLENANMTSGIGTHLALDALEPMLGFPTG